MQVNLRIEVQTTTDTKTDLDGGSGLDEEASAGHFLVILGLTHSADIEVVA